MNKFAYHYSEPFKKEFKWMVHKIVHESGNVLETFTFDTENAAWAFLKTINITIGGVHVHQSVTE